MRQVHFAAFAAPLVLLLVACSGGSDQQPATSSSSAAAQAAPAEPATQTAPAPAPAAATPASDEALAPLFGTWGLDPENCGDKVLKISKSRFEGPGSGCDISGFTDNGDGTYTAAMSCSASGQTSDEEIKMTPIFGPTGEGIDLVYLDRDNLNSQVFRCAAQ